MQRSVLITSTILISTLGFACTRTKTVHKEDNKSRERAEKAETALDEREKALKELEEKNQKLQHEINEKRDAVKDQTQVVETSITDSMTQSMTLLEGVYESAEIQTEIASYFQSKVDGANSSITQLGDERFSLQTKIASDQKNLEQLQAHIATLEGEMSAEARELLANGNEELRNYDRLVEQQTNAWRVKAEAKLNYDKALLDVEKLPKEIEAANGRIKAAQDEIARLEEMFQTDPESLNSENNTIPQLNDLIAQNQRLIQQKTDLLNNQQANVAEQNLDDPNPNFRTFSLIADKTAGDAEKAVSDLEAKMNSARDASLTEKRAEAQKLSESIATDSQAVESLSAQITEHEVTAQRYEQLLKEHLARVAPPTTEASSPPAQEGTDPSPTVVE